MMCKKLIQLLGMPLMLLAFAACSREAVPAADGKVTISFRVGEADTKTVSPGDGNVADGGGIYCTRGAGTPAELTPDLYIFICDWETGTVLKKYPGDADDDGNQDGNVDPDSEWRDGDKSTFLSVTFPFDEEGTYAVYALANISGGDSNLTLPSASDLNAVVDASELDAMLVALAGSVPDVGSRMPLSAKGSLNVVKGLNEGKYNGHVELKMLRCFNKVQFSFRNLTGAELNLYDCQITFRDMNVRQGWLFSASPDFAPMGDGDTDGTDDNYQDFTTSTADITGISNEGEKPFFADPVVFLPSVAPFQTKPSQGYRYLLDISFRVPKEDVVYDAGNSTTYIEKSFSDLPVHTPRSLDIKSLTRNQYLQIITTVSKGLNVSFNFKVNEWEEHTEYVSFD